MIGYHTVAARGVHTLLGVQQPADTDLRAIALGPSAYLGGGDRGAILTEAGAGGQIAAASAAILVTCATTPTPRKQSRLLKRFTELEGFHPELLKMGACFITLTSAGVVTIEEGRLAAGRATQWLREHGYPLYVATTAIQPNRWLLRGESVEHVHICVLGHKRVPVGALRAAWGLGASYHKTPKTVMGVINYIGYMGKNYGRLSWSYALLKLIPGGAKPHVSCYRYVRPDPLNGFPGGVIDFGWGHVRPVREGYSYVPALGRIVPSVATRSPTLLWIAYRMSLDWEGARSRMGEGVKAENAWIKNWKLSELIASDSALPRLQRTIAMSDKGGSHG